MTTRTITGMLALLLAFLMAACSSGGSSLSSDGIPASGPGAGGQTGSIALRIDLSGISPRSYDLLAQINQQVLTQYYGPSVDYVTIDIQDRGDPPRPVHQRTTVFRDPMTDVQIVTIDGVVQGSWVAHLAAFDDQGNPFFFQDGMGNFNPFQEQDVFVQPGVVAQLFFNPMSGP